MKMLLAILLALLLTGGAQAEGQWQEAEVVNCEEWVSLRASPSAAAQRLAKVPLGERVPARVFDSDFAQCEYQGLQGYILLDYLTLTRPEPENAAAEGMLQPNVNEFLSLRSYPSAAAAVIEEILPGEEMTLLGWSGGFAKVRAASGHVGYVNTGYVQAAEGYSKPWPSDYDRIAADMARLEASGAQLESIGQSLDGRELWALRIGSGDCHILIQAGIHGREVMTGQLAVDLATELIRDHPGGIEGVTFHILPATNPDGLTIALHGAQAINNPELRSQAETLLAREGTDHSRWKANARGTDLNRNFATGWQALTGRTPGSQRYRGKSPLSEPESRALAKYLARYPFCATVSYHSYGSVIYWQGAQGETARRNKSLAEVFSRHTGYPLEGNELATVERGGFKDWALMDCGVPSITVEIGAMDSTGSVQEYSALLMRHRGSWEALAQWALAQHEETH